MCIPSNGQRLASMGRQAHDYELARIQFDHQAFVDRRGQVFASWHGLESTLASLGVNLDPLRKTTRFGGFDGGLGAQVPARTVGQLDHIAGTHAVGGNIHALAIDQHAVMAHHLASLRARRAETHAIGDGVETAFEELQQILAGLPLLALGIGELRNAVI